MKPETITTTELEEIGLAVREPIHACMTCRYYKHDEFFKEHRLCLARGGVSAAQFNRRADCPLWEPSQKELARQSSSAVTHRSTGDRLIRAWGLVSFVFIVTQILLKLIFGM